MIYLAIIASMIYLSGFWVYNGPVLRSNKAPDLIPWTIWGMNGFLNAVTYHAVTGNQIMSLLSEAGAIANFVTLLIAIYMGGKGRKLTREEWLILGLGVCCIVASKISPFFGSTFVLFIAAIGAVPVWRGLQKNPKAQKTLPWALWTAGLAINLIVVVSEFRSYVELIQPAAYLVFHGAVTLQTAPD